MIDKTIIDKLIKRNGKYNFTKLVQHMQNSGYNFKDKNIRGSLAIATINGVLLNMSIIDQYEDKIVYFILLHEIAHMKRINKMGKDTMLSNLSLENFDDLKNHIFREEIFADRYACLFFYHFNKELYPWSETQQLNLKNRQKQYEPIILKYYGKIKNNEENYNEIIDSFIIDYQAT